MSKHGVVINIISLLIFDSVWCQSPPPSPCPSVFRYESDYNGWHGVVVARNPPPPGSRVVLQVILSSTGIMSGGRLEIPKEIVQERIETGEPLEYTVVFPENSQLPKVDQIVFDNNVICRGSSPYQNTLTLTSTIRSIISNPNKPSRPPVNNNINNNQQAGTRFRTTTQNPNIGNECGVSSKRTGIVALIYGGKETQRGDWPWSVAIYVRKRNLPLTFICGGSLISKNKVLTAAHCMYDNSRIRPSGDMLLKFGGNNLNDDTEDTQSKDVRSYAIEENYDSSNILNDIAMITLVSEVVFNVYVRPVCLWTSSSDGSFVNQRNAIVVGWGLDANDQLVLDSQKEVDMPIVSNEMCRGSRVDFHSLTSDTTLCAGGKDGSGPCQGDSGGGLYVQVQNRWYVRGIVSKALQGDTRKCNLKEYVIFTDVAKFRSWVNRYK